jgi:hypothetical protein
MFTYISGHRQGIDGEPVAVRILSSLLDGAQIIHVLVAA